MPLPWKWLVIDGWKSHGVPSYLVHSVLEDLTARAVKDHGMEPGTLLSYEEQEVTSAYIDEPGISITNMPTMDFKVDGLTIEMPVHDVGVMRSQLRNARRRTFSEHGKGLGAGMDYYKLHGFCRCLVLTPDIRSILLEQMDARVDEAEAIADAFMEARKGAKAKA